MDVPLLEVETAILGQTAPLTQTSAVDESHVLAANALLRNVRSSADMPTAAGGHECTARSPEGLGHRETGIDRSQRAITTIQHERAGGELPVEPLTLRSVLNSSTGMRGSNSLSQAPCTDAPRNLGMFCRTSLICLQCMKPSHLPPSPLPTVVLHRHPVTSLTIRGMQQACPESVHHPPYWAAHSC